MKNRKIKNTKLSVVSKASKFVQRFT